MGLSHTGVPLKILSRLFQQNSVTKIYRLRYYYTHAGGLSNRVLKSLDIKIEFGEDGIDEVYRIQVDVSEMSTYLVKLDGITS